MLLSVTIISDRILDTFSKKNKSEQVSPGCSLKPQSWCATQSWDSRAWAPSGFGEKMRSFTVKYPLHISLEMSDFKYSLKINASSHEQNTEKKTTSPVAT